MATGLRIQLGFNNLINTTLTFYKCYIHYCLTGASDQGSSQGLTYRDSIFESNDYGLITGDTSRTLLDNCWFEANLTTDIYFSHDSETTIRGGKINAGSRQTFFHGNFPKSIMLDGVDFYTSHPDPILINREHNFAGAKLILRDCTFPPNMAIGTVNQDNMKIIGNVN